MLPLKDAPKEMFNAALENAGFRDEQAILNEG